MTMSSKLYVIGIGYRPLDRRAREVIYNSEVILASHRLFEVFKGYDEFEAVRDRVKVINNVNETIEFIKRELEKLGSIVLLASGDPMFFGIGRRAVKEFGRDMVEILPDLSSIQLAFSRIKEPWDDAFLMSLHGGPDPEKRRKLPYEITEIPLLLQKHNKIAILTDRENNPSEIARTLSLSPLAQSLSPVMYVCERLGYADEKITRGSPQDIAGMRFSEPNVVILQNQGSEKIKGLSTVEDSTQKTDIVFGLREEEIEHSRGLITKDEVRAVTIHKLRLPQKGIFWDIGAGSGSVSLEIARSFNGIRVYAIEKDHEQIGYLKSNRERFGGCFEIIQGEAPGVLSALPGPDRVFIGGSGGRLLEILEYVYSRMEKGIIVINAVTLETLNTAINFFSQSSISMDVVEVQISRLKNLAGKRHFSPENPVFIITGIKE